MSNFNRESFHRVISEYYFINSLTEDDNKKHRSVGIVRLSNLRYDQIPSLK